MLDNYHFAEISFKYYTGIVIILESFDLRYHYLNAKIAK
jgi:hypothetical protein